MRLSDFRTDPGTFITGVERARALVALKSYFRSYTGSFFERFLDRDHPDELTANDFLAVSMLGVNVPANAAIWIMTDGRDEVGDLLRAVGPFDRFIGDEEANLSPNGHAWKLWRLLRSRRWPEGGAASGLGRTILSKLLAAKRPHLIPVYDKHVGSALLEDPDQDIWALWHERFQGEAGRELMKEAESLRQEAGVGEDVSVLRIIDISIWMRVHGYIFSKDEQVKELADAPQFWTA